MKIGRTELEKIIRETMHERNDVLLEAPVGPIIGSEQENSRDDNSKDPDGHEGEMAKRSLFHMSQQAQQLHDILQGDENLEPWIQDTITKSADYLEKAFKAITYDKGPGQGRL
jgi:hypothetical protein